MEENGAISKGDLKTSDEFLSDGSDEYHEDDLPDLVLDTHDKRYLSFNEASHRLSTSSSLGEIDDSSTSSVIDLLTSLSNIQRSASASDLLLTASLDIDDVTEEEVHAERNGEKEFRVTYLNHRKSYTTPVGHGSDVYKSYLSLFPKEDDKNTEEKAQKRRLEAEKILSQFRKLTPEEQEDQRRAWTEELELVEDQIKRIRGQLYAKMNHRSKLKRLIGISKVETFLKINFNQSWNDFSERTSQNFHSAMTNTTKGANAIQKVAKKSVDHLTNEFKELVNSTLSNYDKKKLDRKSDSQGRDQNSNSLKNET